VTQTPAGWYPDPATPGQYRYWTGDAWTAHTQAAQPAPPVQLAQPAQAAQPARPAPGRGPSGPASYASPGPNRSPYGAPGFVPTPAWPPGYGPVVPLTADGVPLAGWWWRVLASALDSLILLVVGIPVLIWSGFLRAYTAYFQDAFGAGYTGTYQLPSIWDPAYGYGRALLIYEVCAFAIAFLYNGLFLKYAGATLGQLACGLRVVPVDQGRAVRALSGRAIVLRILFYSVIPSLIGLGGTALQGTGALPLIWIAFLVSGAGSIYTLLNVLWPLWDAKRQCLHDKVARTQVVRPSQR